jgi:hypothetical protein
VTAMLHYDGTGKRRAVLVGVNAYDYYGDLSVCVNDVVAISQQLFAGGFNSEHLRVLADGARECPPTCENILTALKAAAKASKPDDLLLFYYSGHGDEEAGESYLIGQNGRPGRLKETAVSITAVKEIMRQASARAKVIMLDACYIGAAIGRKGPSRMAPAFIRRVFEQAEGLAILSSCKQDEKSYVWEKQKRSIFTYYLLEALQGQADNDDKGFVTVADVHRYVTNGVKAWVARHPDEPPQTPTLQAEMVGEIIVCRYTRERLAPAPTQSAPSVAPASRPKGSLFPGAAPGTPSVVPASRPESEMSWIGGTKVAVHGSTYLLYGPVDKPVEKIWTPNRHAFWRKVKAQWLPSNQLVWLKQVQVLYPEQEAENFRRALKKESQLLEELGRRQGHDFPRLLFSAQGEQDLTIVYTALEGPSLMDVFGHGQPLAPSSIPLLVRSIFPLCTALSELHHRHLAHRSLSPRAILLLNGRRAALQDVGLATWLHKPGEGIADYQAPEQLHEIAGYPPGPYTDIYQLGAILYLLITGRTLASIPAGTAPSAYNPAVSQMLDSALLRAVAQRVKDRWPDIYQFLHALRTTFR